VLQCGAWGCFDEFNRLKEDQLSAVSQQIQVIQDAIKGRQPTLKLLGRAVDVDFNAGASPDQKQQNSSNNLIVFASIN
jgi:dynein heavy chain 2, cytosolic